MSNNYSNKRKLNDLEEEQIMERIRNGDKVSTFLFATNSIFNRWY